MTEDRIALVHPASPNSAQSELVWPPLGLCRMASFLERQGYHVDIIEDALYRFPIEDLATLLRDYTVIGFGAMTVQAERVRRIADVMRSDQFIVGGGPHFASLDSVPPGFDAIVRGDGEWALLDVVQNRTTGIIHGVTNQEYVPISFSKISYLKYGDHFIDGSRAISILTTRGGCPGRCKFCGSPFLFGHAVTKYSLYDVVANIAVLSNEWDIKNIRIMDDTFMADPERVRLFCDLVNESEMSFACLARVRDVNPELAALMSRSGFVSVAVGIESSSNSILEKAGKASTVEQATEAVDTLLGAGIDVEALFMIGLPGETRATLADAWRYAQGLLERGVKRAHFQFFVPFPGTEFRQEILAGKHGHILDTDLEHYDHRKPVFLPFGISYDNLLTGASLCFALDNRQLGGD